MRLTGNQKERDHWPDRRKGGYISPTRISGYLGLITWRNYQMIEEWRRLCGVVMGLLNGL